MNEARALQRDGPGDRRGRGTNRCVCVGGSNLACGERTRALMSSVAVASAAGQSC